MLRAALSLVFRSLLFMSLGAVIVIVAQFYGPHLLANVLPENLRPDLTSAAAAGMSPDKVADGLTDIRGALE